MMEQHGYAKRPCLRSQGLPPPLAEPATPQTQLTTRQITRQLTTRQTAPRPTNPHAASTPDPRSAPGTTLEVRPQSSRSHPSLPSTRKTRRCDVKIVSAAPQGRGAGLGSHSLNRCSLDSQSLGGHGESPGHMSALRHERTPSCERRGAAAAPSACGKALLAASTRRKRHCDAAAPANRGNAAPVNKGVPVREVHAERAARDGHHKKAAPEERERASAGGCQRVLPSERGAASLDGRGGVCIDHRGAASLDDQPTRITKERRAASLDGRGAASFDDLAAVADVGALVLACIPLAERVRLRHLSTSLRCSVDASLALVRGLWGEEISGLARAALSPPRPSRPPLSTPPRTPHNNQQSTISNHLHLQQHQHQQDGHYRPDLPAVPPFLSPAQPGCRLSGACPPVDSCPPHAPRAATAGTCSPPALEPGQNACVCGGVGQHAGWPCASVSGVNEVQGTAPACCPVADASHGDHPPRRASENGGTNSVGGTNGGGCDRRHSGMPTPHGNQGGGSQRVGRVTSHVSLHGHGGSGSGSARPINTASNPDNGFLHAHNGGGHRGGASSNAGVGNDGNNTNDSRRVGRGANYDGGGGGRNVGAGSRLGGGSDGDADPSGGDPDNGGSGNDIRGRSPHGTSTTASSPSSSPASSPHQSPPQHPPADFNAGVGRGHNPNTGTISGGANPNACIGRGGDFHGAADRSALAPMLATITAGCNAGITGRAVVPTPALVSEPSSPALGSLAPCSCPLVSAAAGTLAAPAAVAKAAGAHGTADGGAGPSSRVLPRGVWESGTAATVAVSSAVTRGDTRASSCAPALASAAHVVANAGGGVSASRDTAAHARAGASITTHTDAGMAACATESEAHARAGSGVHVTAAIGMAPGHHAGAGARTMPPNLQCSNATAARMPPASDALLPSLPVPEPVTPPFAMRPTPILPNAPVRYLPPRADSASRNEDFASRVSDNNAPQPAPWGMPKYMAKDAANRMGLSAGNRCVAQAISWLAARCRNLEHVSVMPKGWEDDGSGEVLWKLEGPKAACAGAEVAPLWVLTDAVLGELARSCPRLISVTARHCLGVTNASVSLLAAHTPRLVRLDLARCAFVGDASLVRIAKACPSLQYLDVRGCGVQLPPPLPQPRAANRPLFAPRNTRLRLATLASGDDASLASDNATVGAHVGTSAVRDHTEGAAVTGTGNDSNNATMGADSSRLLVQCAGVNAGIGSSTNSGNDNANGRVRLPVASTGDRINTDSEDNNDDAIFSHDGGGAVTDATLRALAHHCPHLAHLNVAECCGVTDEGLSALLRGCPQLTWVNTARCSLVSDASVALLGSGCCPLLDHVNVARTRVADAGITALAHGCPRLRTLVVEMCDGVTDASVVVLSQGPCAKSLEVVDLTGCERVSSRSVAGLLGGDCPLLTSLSVGGTRVSDEAITLLAQGGCPELTTLDTRRCHRVTDAGISAAVTGCPKLRHVMVRSCRGVTDVGVKDLALQCPQLRYLNLRNCRSVSDQGVLALRAGCEELRYLNVVGCPLVTDASKRIMTCQVDDALPPPF
eukprot:jgi/Mesvir1/25700/Mv01895-RA.2